MSNASWERNYRRHLIGLERFLLANPEQEIPTEPTIYLAGMIARELDPTYGENIEPYLLADEDEIDATIRRHDPYLGQNAPIVFIARINAEHLTVSRAREKKSVESVSRFELMGPSRLFSIACHYSLQSGNVRMARLYDFYRAHILLIVRLMVAYLRQVHAGMIEADPQVDEELQHWLARRTSNESGRRQPGVDFLQLRNAIDLSNPN